MTRALTDLGLVVVFVVAATLALLAPGVPWQLEWAMGAPLLLLAPGYALVAALFPARPDAPTDGIRSPGWPARLGLSLVGSALVVAVVGSLLPRHGAIRFTLAPIVVTLAAVTLLAVGVATIRRVRRPFHHRADPFAIGMRGALNDAFGTTGAQSLALVLAVVLLASTLAVAGTTPAADPYSEAHLTGGEGVDVGPEDATLVAGTGNTLGVSIANHEGEPTDYRVVVRLQAVDADGTVRAQERLDDYAVGLAAAETRVVERSVEPTMTGERLRLQVLVYAGSADSPLGPGTADLSLRHWVTVTEGGSA